QQLLRLRRADERDGGGLDLGNEDTRREQLPRRQQEDRRQDDTDDRRRPGRERSAPFLALDAQALQLVGQRRRRRHGRSVTQESVRRAEVTPSRCVPRAAAGAARDRGWRRARRATARARRGRRRRRGNRRDPSWRGRCEQEATWRELLLTTVACG